MRDRIPFLFAALLVAALIAVVGIAAFSINSSDDPPQPQAYDGVISGRVASAVLAVSVSTTGSEPLQPLPAASTQSVAPEPTETDAATTTEAPASTTAPADTTAPDIAITSPVDGTTVSNSVVEFAGTSEAGASVTSGPYAANMAEDGGWTIRLVVSAGYNSTVFTAADQAGNESSARIVVYYEPPTTTTVLPATTTTHVHPPSTTSTTHVDPPSPTTTTAPKPPPSNCPVSGSCSSQWPADGAGARGGEAWRSVIAQYWPAERVQCVVDLIQRESSGNPQANNGGRYLGLLQHSIWGWNGRARAIGLVDGNGITAHPYNGAANIAAGAWLANNSSPWWGPWPPTKTIPSCQALGAG